VVEEVSIFRASDICSTLIMRSIKLVGNTTLL
jgi:hypothetical protein